MTKRVIVWGHLLHSHTHSYTHACFHKAFKALGYETHWMPQGSDTSGLDLPGTVFIVEGQQDGGIPLRNDCKYVLHNCTDSKWRTVPKENLLNLQVYTNGVLKWETEKVGDCTFFDRKGRGIFQPWATDLLPEEIDLEWANLPRKNEIHWIGTICDGYFGNVNEIGAFRSQADKNSIAFHHHSPGSVSFEDGRALIQQGCMAPAIHGTWQAQQGYIACRLFKNVSYGHLPITNSKPGFDLFGEIGVYSSDTAELFQKALPRIGDKKSIVEAMQIVKSKHTFVNRARSILEIL